MPVPLIATGHDVLLSSLVPFLQTPNNNVVAPVLRDYGAGSAIHEQGLYVPFHWEFIEDEVLYQLILNQCGLGSASEAEVTIYARSPRLVWTRYNGIAYYPEARTDMDWKNYFLRDVDIYICDLEVLTEF